MKRLWSEQPTICPVCKGAELIPLHKKAKKSILDWKCPGCGEIYRTVKVMYNLLDK